jgi:hypothetical protein
MQPTTHITSQAKPYGHFEIISLENGKEVWRSPIMQNKILDAGLALIPQHHAGNDSNALEITGLEIGDDDTAVTGADTALGNLVLAGVVPSKIAATNTEIVMDFFAVDAELADGTYKEIGLRAGATLYTRALFTTPYTKVSGRDMIIRYTLSYSAV